MAGFVLVEWQGRQVHAACPDPISRSRLALSEATVRRTERAAAAVQRAGDLAAQGGLEAAARLLLRAEGLASSAIEGIRAPAVDVALAEAGHAGRPGPAGQPGRGPGPGADIVAAWVADNLAVVTDALADPGPLDQARLLAWHRRLMASSPAIAPRHVGAYRDVLGWVGGPNPLVAAHVGVPPERIRPLMTDLFAFIAREDIDPVTQAAVAHGQFETIHPFADGNGRLGRVIIGLILSRRLSVAVPPPVSLRFARDVGGYQSGLTLFRQGLAERWVSWFATHVEAAADESREILDMVADLQQAWRDATRDLRTGSAARRLLGLLPEHPVQSARGVADLLEVSEQAGRIALLRLAERGVLAETGEAGSGIGRPRRWWVAGSLLALLEPPPR
ncbi:MAG: Fic family protein [Acidimicrobiales bacterium]